MMKHLSTYLLLRIFGFPLELMPYSWIHILGRMWGTILYHLLPNFRKYICSNLACAKDLNLSNDQIRKIAKKAAQNICIICLEYPKLYREKDISNITTNENIEKADEILKQGKGLIFFSGHQANWEVHFLEATSRWKGAFISKPRKNPFLMKYLLKIQQKHGGEVFYPKDAIKKSLQILKSGSFLRIVGDEAFIKNNNTSPFLGRRAFSSPLSALLAYKTKVPIVVISSERKNSKYHLTYSDPIYPNSSAPRDTEVKRLMDETLDIFQKSIKKCPEQWLWQMHKWKQQNLDKLRKQYRYDSLIIILPEDENLIKQVGIFRKFYPRELIIAYLPKTLSHLTTIDAEIHTYTSPQECFQDDLRPKLLYNFTKIPKIDKHYKRLSVVRVINLCTENMEESLQSLISTL